MEQDFDGGLERRGGTAPIARELGPKRGVGGASSPYFSSSPSRSSLGGNAAITSSPIRSKPQPVRPKTSSTFDLSDLNMAFRANRSVGLAAATQQQEQTLSSSSSAGTTSSSSAPVAHLGSEHGEGSAFRRLLHPNDYLTTTTAAAADDDNPAARNAWGNGRQQPSFSTRGMTEKDLSNRQPPPKKSSLSAYLQQPSYAQSRSSRGTTPSSSQRPRNPPGATQTLGETQQGGPGTFSGVKPAATKKAGVPLFGSLGNAAAASAGGGLKKTGSAAALASSSQPPQQQAPPGTAPGDALGGSKARGDQVALDQSAAIAYLGGTPPVLRSSTTRSRMRLHVNVAKAVGGGDNDDDLVPSSGARAGGRGGPDPAPQREQLLVTRPTTDGGIINLVPGARAAAAQAIHAQAQARRRGDYGNNDDDFDYDNEDHDEAVEVVEELEEPFEPSLQPPPQRASSSSLRASMPASSSTSPRERQRSPVSLVAPSAAAHSDSPNAGPRSSPLSNAVVRGVEEAVVYIGHHHDIGEANRKLERPTSRKPYLGAAAARGEAEEQATSPSSSSSAPAPAPAKREAHSAGARPAASSVPPPPTGLMLKRTNSFGSAVFRDPKQRPPSRQSSAFPVHLAEPLSSSSGDAAARTTTMTSGSGADQERDDWEPPVLGSSKGDAERSKLKTRQSGQPVDLDDLDSDDEIFQKRYNKRGGGSPVRDWAVGAGDGNGNGSSSSSSNSSIAVGVGPKGGTGGASALVQPLTLNASSSSSSLASVATTSTRRDPVSARRGSLSARRGSDPVADGFAALGSHDDGKWPFSITVNYGDGSGGGTDAEAAPGTVGGSIGGSHQHTPRHIAEMERRRGQGSAADDDLPDDLSEFDLDLDVAAVSPRSSQGGGWPGRTNGSSPSNSINNNNNSSSGSRSRKNSAARSRTNSASHSRSSAKLVCCLLCCDVLCSLNVTLTLPFSLLLLPSTLLTHTQAYASEDAAVAFATKANHTIAASPTFSNLGVYDDDGDGDDANYGSDEESIIVRLLALLLSLFPLTHLFTGTPAHAHTHAQTENEGFEGSHGNFNLESSLPEEFLNLFLQ